MYVCLCNPFTDKDVNNHLASLNGKTRIKDVYSSCTGGESMNCGTCACDLQKMVDTHNNSITISQISEQMGSVVKTPETI